jgi:transcriptional regulator with XRE-family HTH domain
MGIETRAGPLQPLGRRISERRVAVGMTQQQLSARIAMSRAALSHLEAGITVASERSVCLLAGVFGVEPHQLVAGTDYPIAKAERLPSSVPRHTHVDLVLALLDNDLEWCARFPDQPVTSKIVDEWLARLTDDLADIVDPDERARLRDARTRVLRRQRR